YWGFEIGPNDSLVSTQTNPTLNFPGIGTYLGVLIANPGNTTCTDTAFIELVIFPDIEADFSHDWDTCSPGPINFTDMSTIDTPIPNSYTWAFADGTVVNDQNPSHEYQNPGIYVTTLQVEDINGCIDQESTTFEWFPAPNLLVDPDTTNGCEPLTVNFNNQSFPFDNTYTFYWDFGDGNTSDALNPSHTYMDNGIYDVLLASTAPNGCTDTITFASLIQVYDTPIADFSFSFDSCSLDPVSFMDTSTPTDGAIVAWDWDFGDMMGTSDQQNPDHQYTDAGSYTVTLTITDEFFCTHTVSKVVDWFPGPIISISPSVVQGCEPLEVFFENNSFPIAGYITEWDLGDGTITSDPSPTHVYTEAGSYTVIFEQTSPTGCFSRDTFVNLITVDTLPIADFSFAFDSCAIDVVMFSDSSSAEAGDIVSWNWNFGDNVTSPNQSPEHLYPDSGNWPATLIVTNTAGCTDTITRIVDWFPAPIIEVEPSVVKGCEPLEVTFQNNSFPITGYTTEWDLGDGTFSLDASPVHTFVDAGIYTISLTQTGPTGCVNTDTFVNLITVDTLPTSDFTYLFDSCSVDPIIFQDNSIAGSGTLESWDWDFGNGDASIDQTPVYQYPLAGSYDIELIVENSNGCFDTLTQVLDYFPGSDISFEADETRGCQPHTVNFSNFSSPINGYDIIWDFGD
ncbi:MAG: PKD domain-containing protein, partial [Bacteroidota bacterium]